MSKEFNFLVKIYSHFKLRYGIITQEIEKSHISLNNDKITVEKHIEENKILLSNNKIISQDVNDQKKEVFLDDLLFVKVKKSRWLKTLLSVSIFVFVLLFFNGLTWINKSNIGNDMIDLIASNSIFSFAVWIILWPIGVICGFPEKQMELFFNDNEKINFQYYICQNSNAKKIIMHLKSQNVKIKNINKFTNIIIIIITALLIITNIFNILIKSNQKTNNQLENKLVNLLAKNACYVDIEVTTGKFLKSKNDEHIYLLEKTKEKIKVKEAIFRDTNDIYIIFILKYYTKDPNELISTQYVVTSQTESNILNFSKYNKDYYYEKNSKKIYEFNNPNFDLSKKTNFSPYTIFFYTDNTPNSKYIDKDIYEHIYNFVNLDSDEQELENSEYKKIIKVGKYESKYGTCNVIKAIYKCNSYNPNCDDYIIFIENSEGNHLGIFLKYREDMNEKKDNYMDYFKTIIPEKQNI